MFRVLLVIGVVVLFPACATVDPNIKYYEPLAGIIIENSATIIGSRVPQSFPFDDQTVYILGISGQPVRGGKKSYLEPVVLAPGVHRIAIAWVQGSLFANTTVELRVGSGDRLIIRHQRVEKEVARIWIEDSKNGTPITEAVFVHATAPNPGGFIPIFIPRGR